MKTVTLLLVAMFALASVAQHKNKCAGTGHDKGAAIDIGAVGGKPVSLYGKDPGVKERVDKLQEIFNHPKTGGPPPAENYGPGALYRDGKKFSDKKLAKNHSDHIHIRFK
jgi:hypothetical protein